MNNSGVASDFIKNRTYPGEIMNQMLVFMTDQKATGKDAAFEFLQKHEDVWGKWVSDEAAKKIVKKMGDKGKYDSANQTKTLIVMQVLGNSKTFFDSQKQLQDTVGFFTDKTLPDAVINDNDLASYFLFVGSDGLMNEMIESQWQN